MENVKKTKTRRVGNPKWIHIPSDIDVYYVKGNGDKSIKASLYIHHKGLNVFDLTKRESDRQQNNHEVYLKPVTISNYDEVFSGYMAQIQMLYDLEYSPQEIIKTIYDIEKGSKNTEVELDNLKELFKEVNCEFKEQLDKVKDEIFELHQIQNKMELICKEMEML